MQKEEDVGHFCCLLLSSRVSLQLALLDLACETPRLSMSRAGDVHFCVSKMDRNDTENTWNRKIKPGQLTVISHAN